MVSLVINIINRSGMFSYALTPLGVIGPLELVLTVSWDISIVLIFSEFYSNFAKNGGHNSMLTKLLEKNLSFLPHESIESSYGQVFPSCWLR
jgi:hypothetical protein